MTAGYIKIYIISKTQIIHKKEIIFLNGCFFSILLCFVIDHNGNIEGHFPSLPDTLNVQLHMELHAERKP